MFPKNPDLPFEIGEGLVSNAEGSSALLEGQLCPLSVTSKYTQPPSVIGSPVFHYPVPVVQGYNNPLPVDIH